MTYTIQVFKQILLLTYHAVLYALYDLPLFRVYPVSKLKSAAYKHLLGCNIDGACFIHSGVRFINPRKIHLGENVSLMYGVMIEARDKVYIGRNCLVSPGVLITTGDHELANLTPKSKSVTIGENCFIGSRAIILSGVNLGKNSVVGAGSIVTKDVPADTLVAGAPAREIKKLVLDDDVWTLSGMRSRNVAECGSPND
ncbi:acyltransferase [Pontiellaceae bacterium B1224]|nr:acyltransferase [Pontiellaceae bacterium B1224]